jgi:hypothetical protein
MQFTFAKPERRQTFCARTGTETPAPGSFKRLEIPMFHPDFPELQRTAARVPLIRDTARQELIALISSELLFLAALIIVAGI